MELFIDKILTLLIKHDHLLGQSKQIPHFIVPECVKIDFSTLPFVTDDLAERALNYFVLAN